MSPQHIAVLYNREHSQAMYIKSELATFMTSDKFSHMWSYTCTWSGRLMLKSTLNLLKLG